MFLPQIVLLPQSFCAQPQKEAHPCRPVWQGRFVSFRRTRNKQTRTASVSTYRDSNRQLAGMCPPLPPLLFLLGDCGKRWNTCCLLCFLIVSKMQCIYWQVSPFLLPSLPLFPQCVAVNRPRRFFSLGRLADSFFYGRAVSLQTA